MAGGTKRRDAASAVIKRSVLIAGHSTSISIEDAFWDGLKVIAAMRGCSVAALVADIDKARQAPNLSSAIRVFVLRHYREKADQSSVAETLPEA